MGNTKSAIELKKVAFVAMPFGTKPTGLLPGTGPSEVNFDAIWEKAISPALSELGYLPIRADNQSGSVIIKDMLEQLMHADLLLADISIPNGNVYYEAGVRHAARETGCILLRADWSSPLFDLAQITQLLYPGTPAEPTDESYRAIYAALVSSIPDLCDSIGPVFTLTQADAGHERTSLKLKEVYSDLFEFQEKLATARLQAADNQKAALRALLDDHLLTQLPGYALRDLVAVVRDYLHWGELVDLVDLINTLSKKLPDDPYINEQKAHALSKLGRCQEAIALLETIIDTHGETPERLGTLGGRYRELARGQDDRQKRRSSVGKAITAYHKGMQLDLNQYYCAQKLLVALIERGRTEDKNDTVTCAMAVRSATERAISLNGDDEWIESTMAVLAFYEKDTTEARKRIDKLLDGGWTNWKLVDLALDLESILGGMDESHKAPFQEILQDLRASLPVTQLTLLERVLPLIKNASNRYRKFQPIHARPARIGEVVVSTTADGEETTNTAETDDFVVKNLTEAQELYLVGRAKFEARYTWLEAIDEEWNKYCPKGEVLSLEITRDVSTMLAVGEEFYIEAPWGTEQLAREGDMIVSPWPAIDEVYRIARKEFDETYKLAEDH